MSGSDSGSEVDVPSSKKASAFANMESDSESESDGEAPAVEVAAAPSKLQEKGKSRAKGKKGKTNGGAKGGAGVADDDIDAIMAEFGKSSGKSGGKKGASNAPAPAPAAAPMEDPAAAAAAFLAQIGAGGGADDVKKDNKKKKKKKKGASDKKEEEEEKKPKQSAAGKALAERLAKQRAEEERIKKQEEEEARRIAEEEAKAEAARKAVEDEKARKRTKAKERLERKKKEGTYKTKKQKEQEARSKAAVEAMVAAGLQVPSGSDAPGEAGQPEGGKKSKVVYSKKKSAKSKQVNTLPPPLPVADLPEKGGDADAKKGAPDTPDIEAGKDGARGSPTPAEKGNVQSVESAAVDDWEDAVDDWDTADVSELIGNITVKDGTSGAFEDEEEDLIEKEKREEKERLRQQGIRQQKLEAQRKEEEERHRQEEAERQREIQQAEMRKEEARRKRIKREQNARASRTPDSLRSPIVCIMGHVDTGKTKLLDKIRQTSVQEGEAGGITQQIGATFFAKETLCEKVAELNKTMNIDVRLPGMLVIDTPGHESFTNLRSRGSSLCDIAILVVDLMHGLEPQTIESLNLLRSKRTPFVIALNKIDRCYAWKSAPDGPARISLDNQESSTISEFEDRSSRIRTEVMEKGLNTELYWNNNDPAHTVSMVPTSAITGEGIPDLLLWLVKLTQERLTEKIMYMRELLECTVLEVKAIDGLGMTIDVIIVNGYLKEGDTIVVCTLDGPVVTTIRALLTPPPSRELRVKSEYVHHKTIMGAIGVKLCATGIEKAVAGTPIMVVGPDDDEEDIKEEVMRDFTDVMKMDLEPRGVMVQASTLGALEALMQFLRKECDPPIPVFAVGIGPIFKKDVMRAGIMNEKGMSEYAAILAFDVKIDSDARKHADETNVRIFTADIIYHLFDQFTAHMDRFMEQKRQDARDVAVFPCIAKIMKQHIFNMKDPIIVGMEVIEGTLRVGTPLCIPALGGMEIGRVSSIEQNHREVDRLAKGASGAVKMEDPPGGVSLTYGRQFSADSGSLYSSISRETINALKAYFREQLTQDDLRLLVSLKKVFNIP